MLLHELAHARSGDKGNISDITVIVYDARDFPFLRGLVTAERVQRHFSAFLEGGEGDVRRYELPHLGALKFVLEGALDGGVTRSLSLDTHGKCLGSLLLAMDIGDVLGPDPGSGPAPESSGTSTSHGTRR
ncbi:hypothetical protein [Streptomyces sp. NPDC017991]|uniref:AtuA-related protein n=1 Tax=Streptomyces sp. NPDC017991 TaxID=3365026 RepID=UPI0037A3DBBA